MEKVGKVWRTLESKINAKEWKEALTRKRSMLLEIGLEVKVSGMLLCSNHIDLFRSDP